GLGDKDAPYGPWNTFADEDLSGWHLAIDEIHNYVPKAGIGCRRIAAAWSKWLGELRHRGATIEFLSQAPAKVSSAIENEAEIRYELVSSKHRPDPFLGVKMEYWYQLQAKLTGIYRPSCWQQELRNVNGKWTVQEESPFWFDDELFGVYDTWSAPIAGGHKGSTGKQPYQLYSLPRLLAWFWWSNAWPLTWRPAVAGAFVAAVCNREMVMQQYFKLTDRVFVGRKAQAGAGQGSAEKAALATAATAEAPPSNPPAWLSGGRNDLTAQRIAFLEDEIEQLQGELLAKTSKIDELQSKLELAFSVASVTLNQVTFRGGYTYAVGETIDWGPYEGRAVAFIAFPRRGGVLSDGQRLRMGTDAGAGSQWLQGAASKADAAAASAGVPGALPSSGIRSAGDAARSVLVGKGDSQRKRD